MQNDSERQELRRNFKDAVSNEDAGSAIRYGRTLLASGKPADIMFCASAFTRIADALSRQPAAKRLKAYIVRSVTVEPILPFLTTEAVLSNFVLDLQVGGYGSYVDEMLNPQSALAKFKPDIVLVLLDLEDIAGRLPDLCADGDRRGCRGGDRRVCCHAWPNCSEVSAPAAPPGFSSRDVSSLTGPRSVMWGMRTCRTV